METAAKAVHGVWLFSDPTSSTTPARATLPTSLIMMCFAGDAGTSITPTKEEVEGFNAYLENYKQCLGIEIAAVEYKK